MHQSHIRFSLHAVAYQCRHIFVFRRAQIRGFRGIHHLENPVSHRRNDQMSALIHNSQESARFCGLLNGLLHVVQKNIRPGYAQQGAVRII